MLTGFDECLCLFRIYRFLVLLHDCRFDCNLYVLCFALEFVWFRGDLVWRPITTCTYWGNYMIMVYLFALSLCIGSYLLFCLRWVWVVGVVCWV